MEECCPLTNRDELPDVRPSIITYFDSFRLLVSLASSALVEPAECFNIGVWFKLVSLVKEVRNTLVCQSVGISVRYATSKIAQMMY